jgi:3-phosphoshikimate 1-carboxyvinyltransferase
MKIIVSQSQLKGKVKAPPSKSQTIRGLMCAALARGESQIIDPLICEDTDAAKNVLRKVGIHIQQEEGLWRVRGGTFRAPDTDLYCGESATTLRFMTAICSLVPGKCRLVGGPSLSTRPVKSLVEALRGLGVRCSLNGETPPVTVEGGALKGGVTELPGNISSQFISALLLIAPLATQEVTIRLTTALTSAPYVAMTLQCLKKFGVNARSESDKFIVARQIYRPASFRVEGDWSSASYFLALGAVSDGIEIENLDNSSLQGDRVMLDFLRSMGAQVRTGVNFVAVSRAGLKSIRANLADCIDLLPAMGVLAALADGVSEFAGIARARLKESDRVAAVKEELERIGATVTEDKDRLTIAGLPRQPRAANEVATIDSRGDHRIAMAFGVLGTAIGGIVIDGAECVAKTFPDFWEALKSIGGKLEAYAE